MTNEERAKEAAKTIVSKIRQKARQHGVGIRLIKMAEWLTNLILTALNAATAEDRKRITELELLAYYDCPEGHFTYKEIADDLRDDNEALKSRIAELEKDIERAVKIIRTWHGMGHSEPEEKELWEIYYNNAPEMKPFRRAAEAVKGDEDGD